MDAKTIVQSIGGFAFGTVIGWVTLFYLAPRSTGALTDISTLIGALGGATIIGLFSPEKIVFAGYGIGLAAGFFAYFYVFKKIVGLSAIGETLLVKKTGGEGTEPSGGAVLGGRDSHGCKIGAGYRL